MKETSVPTRPSRNGDRTIPTADSVSGHRSRTHITIGTRYHQRRKTAGSADVIGDDSNMKIASYRARRSNHGPRNTAQKTKLQ
jgi:hypothetical protein